VAAVMIGVDPHKGSHTAVAVSVTEEQLGKLRVRASDGQARQLTEWAASWPERTWAVEGASGLGHLLAQQLIAAGERVLDVQPKLGARVRLLAAGGTNKNDPNDARSVAIAALRSAGCRQVRADDHTAVLKLWSKRNRDLGRSRNQVACRLHSVLCELVPGGVGKEITASHAARLLAAAEPSGPAQIARWQLASDFLEDLRRLDEQMKQAKKKLAAAVKASGTTDGDLRRRPGRRCGRARRGGGRGPVPGPRPVRGLQRHRADRGVLWQADGAPAVPARQPARQPRDPHGRDHADPARPQRGPRVLREEGCRGQDFERGPARPEAAHQRRPVPAAAR
jgi:hypothetical protein